MAVFSHRPKCYVACMLVNKNATNRSGILAYSQSARPPCHLARLAMRTAVQGPGSQAKTTAIGNSPSWTCKLCLYWCLKRQEVRISVRGLNRAASKYDFDLDLEITMKVEQPQLKILLIETIIKQLQDIYILIDFLII